MSDRLEEIRARLAAAAPELWHTTAGDFQLLAHAPEDIAYLLELLGARVGTEGRLRERIKELEVALRPFAKCATVLDGESKHPDEYNDAEPCAFTVQPTLRHELSDFTVGDLRRARGALND